MAVTQTTSKPRMEAGPIHPHTIGAPMRDTMREDENVRASRESGPEGDRRGAPRFALLIRAAKLTSPEGEFLCVVRDASEIGVSVRLFHPIPAGIPLTLELPNGDRHPVERVWEEDGKVGLSFVGPVDLERIVENRSGFAKRPVRVNLEVACELLVGIRRVDATILNLSQQGAQIRTTEKLALLQRVTIKAEGMPEISAKVRWRNGQTYGLSFEDTFQFAELAALAFELRRDA